MGTIRKFDLKEYIEKYNLEYFIETGTLYGDGVEYATQFDFKHIYSYELYQPVFKIAFEKFKTNNKITILNHDSGTELYKLTNTLDGNILFFFDAHFPGADARLTDYIDEKNKDINLPLFKELEQIKNRVNKHNDVIIIDDLRLFLDDDRIQSAPLNKHLNSIGKNYITRKDLVHFDLVEYLDKTYKKYFNIVLDFRDEGYLIFTKK